MSELRLRLYSLFQRPILSAGRRLKWLGRSLRVLPQDLTILRAAVPRDGQVRVYYGYNFIPGPVDRARIIHGGLVKVQRMQEFFPNSPSQFNILYLVSSALPKGERQKAWLSRKIGARLVLNQNGVAYPGWPDAGWKAMNAPMTALHREADYVFYQSEFCKRSADRFLSERRGPWEVLYNPVDTRFFTPALTDPFPDRLVLLLGGDQYQYYRLECALKVLALILRQGLDAKLMVTGRLCWIPDERAAARQTQELVRSLKLEGRVEFSPPYAQADAPGIFRKAHLLLHTKYNDPSPGLVTEAMACGLPVVYSRSGGVPELVNDEAGVGVPAELCWDRDVPPDPEALAAAVRQVAADRKRFSEAARRRAVERFDLKPWIERHRVVFEKLLQ
jgi:glycosyltransferase involved in cell wall biosynthesis